MWAEETAMSEDLKDLSDEALLASLKSLVAQERHSIVDVLRHLAEVDLRNATAPTAYSSLFIYCVRELGFFEDEAYRRITAARKARQYPLIFSMLERGEISLTIVSLLSPHLCRENYSGLLKQAAGKSRREVERIVAALDPKRETPDRIEFLGTRAASRPAEDKADAGQGDLLSAGTGAARQVSADAAGYIDSSEKKPESDLVGRVRLKFTADETLLAKIQRVKGLLSHKYPSGRLEFLINEAMEALLDKKDPIRRLKRREQRRKRKQSELLQPEPQDLHMDCVRRSHYG